MFREFEQRKQPLAKSSVYTKRVVRYLGLSSGIILFSLVIGTLGYHGFERMPWLEAMLNAAMILGGEGPVDTLHTAGGKVFASFYSLFSGVVFLVAVGVLIAPVFHRFLHNLHLDVDKNPEGEDSGKE